MTDHIPLPAPDYTENVQGFVHDTQRHYYAEETMRAYAERLHAARVNSPAILQAIGLLSTLQTLIGPHRPEDSKHKKQALWDQIEATRIALTPLAPAGAPAAKAAHAVQGDAAHRTNEEILNQTVELTKYLLEWKWGLVPEGDASRIWESGNTKAQVCRNAACHIQDLLTQTDVWNAVNELDDARSQAKEGGDAA